MKRLLFLNLIFCGFLSTLFAQTTVIPDSAFEAKLIQLGIDSDGVINGQVLTADVVNVTSLNVSGTYTNPGSIKDLTGIEDFINLTQLSCANDSLSTLDLSANTLLVELNCSNNILSSINLSNNTALEHLDCFINNLSTLNLNNNTILDDLNCAENNLSTLDVSNSPLLENLNCAKNNLSTLDVSTNTNLQVLSCAINNLSTLNLNSTNLVFLDCGYNNLSILDLSTTTNLERFYCTHNNLSALNLSTCPNLRYFFCYNNNLSTLNLSTCPNLYSLFCEYNNLSTLNLSGCVNLRLLGCNDNNLSTLDLSTCLSLQHFTCYNNQLIHLNLQNGNNNSLSQVRAFFNDSTLVICIDDPYQNPPSFWEKDLTATYSDICNTNLKGILAHDSNINCLVDSTESLLSYHIIEATNIQTGIKKYTTSTILGHYRLGLDTGTYTIAPIPKNSYWATCIPAQTITIDTTTTVDTLDLPMQAVTTCPLLTVTLSAPFLRATGGGSNYTVYYCNDGTAEASNPYIEVRIDTGLNVLGTSIPYSNQNGNLYTFPIDTLNIGECGNFTINVIADSNLQMGQTLCSEAHIYPDSICLPIWNDAIIEASATCLIDTIAFKLKNTGSDMLTAQNYTIFEDDIIVRMDSFRLNGGDSIIIKQVALPNKIYRIEANQPLGFPSALGAPIAHTTVTNCNAISSNLGILPQFYSGNSSPSIDVDCQQLVAAYDPNDKTAQPKGYGVNNYLLPNLPIDYKVRFQNTGNDTAFLVVILDTLSPHVDITSIQMGASSHPYTWELKGAGLLVVTFEDIKLVDSTTNEPLSNGFFTYSIQQQPDLPTGTVINNQAAIYFDYNPPILTNTAFHTIARYFHKSRSTIDSTICETDSFWINGILVDTTGMYTETLTGASGQDSVTIWNITIQSNPSLFYKDTLCGSIIINGITYDSSGVYTQLLIDTLGCDTIFTIDLTINYSRDTTFNIITCDSFLFNGQVYTTSGQYTQPLQTINGCDSTIWLNLTLYNRQDTNIQINACDSVLFNGQIYTTSGQYIQQLQTINGCDSTIYLTVQLLHTTDTLSIQACDSFVLNNQVYTTSGQYIQQLQSTDGCDSNLVLNVIIDTIDTSIAINGTTLTANATGATYQWLDCMNNFSPIQGATQQSFTPIQDGDYAVEINKSTCSIISTCQSITLLNANQFKNLDGIQVYPNPTTGLVNINLNQILAHTNVQIFTTDGKLIHQQKAQNNSRLMVNLSKYPKGLYLLRVNTGSQVFNLKIVKQ